MRFAFTFATLMMLAANGIFSATPDEIALKTRASQFYSLQIERKRTQAAELVEPKNRDLFLSGKSVPYSGYKISRVLITGTDAAEVEVNVELTLEMFPQPVSKSLTTNWKKIGGKWYFVMDTSALDLIRSRVPALPAETKAVLSYKPLVSFGQDSEIQKSVRLENNTAGTLEFRLVGWDDQWFDIKNRSGDIPAGEYFPLVITLKQMPERHEKQSILVEGILPDKQVHRLEIPVILDVPVESLAKAMRDKIRQYRRDH